MEIEYINKSENTNNFMHDHQHLYDICLEDKSTRFPFEYHKTMKYMEQNQNIKLNQIEFIPHTTLDIFCSNNEFNKSFKNNTAKQSNNMYDDSFVFHNEYVENEIKEKSNNENHNNVFGIILAGTFGGMVLTHMFDL